MCAAQSIKITLVNEGLWKTFGDSNEMIVSRKGRNLFPMLAVQIGNLEPAKMYTMSVRMIPLDKFKYRFENGSWKQQSFITEADPIQSIGHHDGYKSGMEWMEGGISFPTLKLSNDKLSNDPNVFVLQPSQRYMPYLDIWQLQDDQLSARAIFGFGFESIKFITVTAYKDKKISELKKVHNKHAAGKRSRTESPEDDDQPKKRKCQTVRASPDVEDPPQLSFSPAAPLQPCYNTLASVPEDFSTQIPAHPCSAIAAHPAPTPVLLNPNNCNFVPSDPFEFPATSQDSNSHIVSNFNAPTAPVPYSNPSLVYPLDPYHAANFFIPHSPADRPQDFVQPHSQIPPVISSHHSHFSTIMIPDTSNQYVQSSKFQPDLHPPF